MLCAAEALARADPGRVGSSLCRFVLLPALLLPAVLVPPLRRLRQLAALGLVVLCCGLAPARGRFVGAASVPAVAAVCSVSVSLGSLNVSIQ